MMNMIPMETGSQHSSKERKPAKLVGGKEAKTRRRKFTIEIQALEDKPVNKPELMKEDYLEDDLDQF